jgi:alanine racemase
MDLATLDVTAVPEERVHPGADVEFLGDTITLEEAAAAAGTINHEILTALSPRAERVYSES